jgi:hypothetical protein
MKFFDSFFGRPFFLSPEHGGQSVHGGTPHGASADEEIADGLGETFVGHGKVPGTSDPGVPGSKTNPVGQNRAPEGEMEGEEDPNLQRPGGKNDTNVRP